MVSSGSVDVNGTPDGRYAGRQARRLRAAVALPAVKRFVARSRIEPTVIRSVNSRSRRVPRRSIVSTMTCVDGAQDGTARQAVASRTVLLARRRIS